LRKLTHTDIFEVVKQNFSYAWLLRPHALRKLTHTSIFEVVKQNLNYAESLDHILWGN